jgi:peptide/nickel transport system ATP-binding protein
MLEVSNLDVALPDRTKKPLFGSAPLLPILHDVNLVVAPGETLGIVGESGSGKSTLGRTLVRIYRPQRGRIVFEGRDIAGAEEADLKPLRRRIQMIFQDSQSALNPRQRVRDILAGPLLAHQLADRRSVGNKVDALLERVGMTPRHAERYPHQLSGGQRQRLGIARALSLEPIFIVADEIVSGLDVSVQTQILDLLRRLRGESRMGMIFISHDLSVVRTLCDRIAVIQHGRIIETGDCAAIFDAPRHPYTRLLLRAVPLPVVDRTWLDRRDEDDDIATAS